MKGKVIGGTTNADSYVQKVDPKGDTLYIGGNFTNTGYDASNLASVTTSNDIPDINFPNTDGIIYSIVSDGSGGWYVGGSFNNIGGVARQKLAHVKSDLTIDANPNVTINSDVRAIVKSGTTLYIAGHFTQISSTTRNYLAAINGNTSALISWDPNANNQVYTLVLRDTTFYAGGAFTTIGGKARYYISPISKNTGKALPGLSDVDSYVQKISNKGDTLIIGGNFTNVGYTQPYLASFTTSSDKPDRSFPTTNGEVRAIISDGAGGYFCRRLFHTNRWDQPTLSREIKFLETSCYGLYSDNKRYSLYNGTAGNNTLYRRNIYSNRWCNTPVYLCHIQRGAVQINPGQQI